MSKKLIWSTAENKQARFEGKTTMLQANGNLEWWILQADEGFELIASNSEVVVDRCTNLQKLMNCAQFKDENYEKESLLPGSKIQYVFRNGFMDVRVELPSNAPYNLDPHKAALMENTIKEAVEAAMHTYIYKK